MSHPFHELCKNKVFQLEIDLPKNFINNIPYNWALFCVFCSFSTHPNHDVPFHWARVINNRIFCCNCAAPAGINNDALHRLSGADIQLVLCVSGRKGRSGARWRNRFCQLRGCAVVGRDHSDDNRLRWHRAANVDGQNCGLVL